MCYDNRTKARPLIFKIIVYIKNVVWVDFCKFHSPFANLFSRTLPGTSQSCHSRILFKLMIRSSAITIFAENINAQIAGNRISRVLVFKIFWGGACPHTPLARRAPSALECLTQLPVRHDHADFASYATGNVRYETSFHMGKIYSKNSVSI